jgi:hypothetical protein
MQINHYCFRSLIAIHGLDGHREESWTHENGVLWLRDLIPQKIPNARVLTYGHPARTRGRQIAIPLLFELGRDFVRQLTLFRGKSHVCKLRSL